MEPTVTAELAKLGYREDNLSLEEQMGEPLAKESMYPYCSWYKCTGVGAKRVLKSITPTTRHYKRCKSCGHEIEWKKKITGQDKLRIQRRLCNHVFRPRTQGSPWVCDYCDLSKINFERGWYFFNLN